MLRGAAVEEGVVPGGGVALIRAHEALDGVAGDNSDQDVGIRILRRAIEEPLRLIVANSGAEPSVILNKVAENEGNFGYNVVTSEFGDMVEMGILDPTKVVRCALQNAASVAGPAVDHRSDGRRGTQEGRRSRNAADG